MWNASHVLTIVPFYKQPYMEGMARAIIHVRLVNIRHPGPRCCLNLEGSTRSKGWHGYSPRRGLAVYSHVSHPHGERCHMQAILHTPRPRKGRGAWSTKVVLPSHGVRAQGGW
jgi:hypothetical protein